MKVVPLRLHPGEDLRRALEAWMGEQQQQAGCMISAVGSLSVAQLRLAGASETTTICGELEIISLSGTLSPDGAHLHIAIADSSGAVIGGHLGPVSADNEVGRSATSSLAGWVSAGHPGADAQGPGDASTTDEPTTQPVHGKTTRWQQPGSCCCSGGHLGAQCPPD